MTIIAGFKSHEGIVICADTQETAEPSKRYSPKLVFEPAEHAHGSTDDLAAAFCGSSENGPYVDKLIGNAWESAQTATSLDEACAEIEKSIKATYREFGAIYQTGYCPTATLIYGVKMFGGTRLFAADGPVVNEKKTFETSGIGLYLADFLASRMYTGYMTIAQCVILGAYILFQAKEHVEGCGGDSHIAVLREHGISGRVGWKQVEAITEILKIADHDVGELLIQFANLDISEDELRKQAHLFVDVLSTIRDNHREHLSRMTTISELMGGDGPQVRDSLGFLLDEGKKRSKGESI